MQVIEHIQEMQALAESFRMQSERIGVVPTMGCLHEGHLSLIRLAREHSDVVVATLFVNPMQFGPNEDFERYPRDFQRDRQLAAQAGVDLLFSPQTREMIPDGCATYVEVEGVSTILEGKFRPAHFRGVTTIVAKLLNIVKPHVAVFGQKDAQQVYLIKKMVADLNLDLRVIVGPIVRERDGLALSSRNVYLSPEERTHATALHRSLRHAEERIAQGERSVSKLRAEMMDILAQARPSQVDYVAFVDPDLFKEIQSIGMQSVRVALAVRFGSTRLIDNVLIQISS